MPPQEASLPLDLVIAVFGVALPGLVVSFGLLVHLVRLTRNRDVN